ncbi:hypothetical protein BJ878DRAFT_516685 [Calycina marina]|uniref:C2H2-type domain-containing protein n=1 Tax=Calycina marina TaxID=1763456 RepID=A0A9P7YZT3_9HELO|nr:hypothetical protein BJ878DRAFT_516685 [Calycina marina]
MQSHSLALVGPLSSTTQFRCCDCERDFKNEGALADHLRCSSIHKPAKGGKNNKKKNEQNKKGQGSPQRRCEKCNKSFKNTDALNLHLSSVRHHPLSDINCLADTKCKKRFNCPSGQLQHLESGRCLSGMTKRKLNRAITVNDVEHIITSRGGMTQTLLEDNLSASTSSTSQTRSPILTPTSTQFLGSYPPSLPSLILTAESALSTSANFHSMLTHRLRIQSGFHLCHICPPSRTRTFTGRALQQHLSSNVHTQRSTLLPGPHDISFHCPRTLMGKGDQKMPLKQFSTVSGLAQYLESGACNGGTGNLRRVIDYVQEEMKGIGFGGLKLLLS